MSAFDTINNAVQGSTQQIVIPPTAENCPDPECKYWNGTQCVFAECRYTVPELIIPKIFKRCIICQTNGAEVSPRSGDYVCPTCRTGILYAIKVAHEPGD